MKSICTFSIGATQRYPNCIFEGVEPPFLASSVEGKRLTYKALVFAHSMQRD